MYQNEFLEELHRQENILVYGPGEKMFDPNLDINQVIKKIEFVPDWIIVGHAWLSDKEHGQLDDYSCLNLVKTSIPKAIILNKEYVRLDDKLDWIRNNNFQLGFSHHHDVEYYSNVANAIFHFLPFAFDANKVISVPEQNKSISLAFSGMLQNQNRCADQSDVRVRVMNELFITLFDIPFFKRKLYRNMSIFWNAIPRKLHHARLARLLNKYSKMSDLNYYKMQKSSVIFFNSLSPMGIISPRIFENMACKAVPFSAHSEIYSRVFDDDSIVTFNDDLSDFYDKLSYYLENIDLTADIADKNYNNVFANHTWEIRIKELLSILKDFVQ